MKKLRDKKYFALIGIIIIFLGVVFINKIGSIDKYAGEIKVTKAYVDQTNTSLSANVIDIVNQSNSISKGYDEVDYVIKYSLDENNEVEERNVIIKAKLDENEKYASFKKIDNEEIESSLSENRKEILIKVKNAKVGKENEVTLKLLVEGAPNGYTINPQIEIKEETDDKYTNITTNILEVKTNSITGIVKDIKNLPVSNIELKIIKNEEEIKRTYTDSEGKYVFTDLEEGNYKIEVEEEIYEKVSESNITVKDGQVLDLIVKQVKPYEIKINKYITSLKIINNGKEENYTYGEIEKVQQSIKNLKSITGEIKYKIVVQNVGTKEGIVTVVKDEIPEGLKFDEKKNTDWIKKDGVLYNRTLEGVTLKPNQKIEVSLVLDIESTSEAKTYINKVTAKGEVYERVVYILDGKTYKEEEVLEGEKIQSPNVTIKDFEGWYTDKKYTNKYNFNNEVTKDLILYGKITNNEIYKVEFYDNNTLIKELSKEENKNIKEKELPEVSKKGYTFKYWSLSQNGEEYDIATPIKSDIKLYSVYDINKYNIEFYDKDKKIKTIEKEYNSNIINEEIPKVSKEGYSFIGWYEDAAKETFDFTTKITKNIKLYSKYKITTNAVIFNDENRITTKEVEYGSIVEPIKDQGKEGYTFSHWSEEINGTPFDFNTPIKETTTLYTVYLINKYNVEFIDEDNVYNTQEVEYQGLITKPENPTKQGHTFKYWSLEKNGLEYNLETKVTKNIKLYSVYEINTYTVNFIDKGLLYKSETVNYNEKVEIPENPIKDNNIFIGWTLNNNLYDFNLPVTDNITLYSSYEEVEKPVISHAPTSWVKDKVTVTIKNDNHPEYGFIYKIDDGEYQNYTGEFIVEENCTVIAKSIKNNVESIIETHVIDNIDKIKPTITKFEEDNVTPTSFDVNIKSIDNESGMSILNVYKNDELIVSYTYENNLNEEKQEIYTFTGLEEKTSYKIKVEAIDKVGNVSEIEEKDITTTARVIVARIIGRENSLYESEENYENFTSLELAVNACPSGQCTIQMVLSTIESVDVLQGQDITLDINGKTISGVSNYTLQNSGNLIIVDNAEEAGSITNTKDTALKNINTGLLQLGINEEPLTVSNEVPNIIGANYGVYTDETATFNFFDGRVEATQAIKGTVDETPYLYNAKVEIEDNQVATLSILAEAEARINTTYYTQLAQAVDESANGQYVTRNVEEDIMKFVVTPSTYGFEYDEETKTLKNNNQNISSSTAHSYIILDLTDYEIDQELVINASISSYSTFSTGKASISETTSASTSYFLNMSGSILSRNSSTVLEKGKKYYLHLKYEKIRSYTSGTDTFTINSINLRNYVEKSENVNSDSVVTSEGYSFVYNENNELVNNNSRINNSLAHSYIELDLTDSTEDKNISINAELSTSYAYAYAQITEDINIPNYSDSTNKLIYLNYTTSATDYSTILEKGKKYYLHIGYYSYGTTDPSVTDTFKINNIEIYKVEVDETLYIDYENIKTDSTYSFVYNSETGTLTSNNNGINNSVANSYIIFDMTQEEKDRALNINAEISSERGYDIGYITVTNSSEVPLYTDSTNRYVYISGVLASADYTVKLKAGQINYLHIGYRKDSGGNTGTDTFTINSIKGAKIVTQSQLSDMQTKHDKYGFDYDASTGEFKSNNSGLLNTTAHSYIEYQPSEDTSLLFTASIKSYSNDRGKIIINNSKNASSSDNSIISISGTTNNIKGEYTFKANTLYYIHFLYEKGNYSTLTDDVFTINSIKKISRGESNNQITGDLTVVEINKEPDTVELIKDITLSDEITIEETRNVIIDLNGHTLSSSTSNYIIDNYGTLKIKDSVYDSSYLKAQENQQILQQEYDEKYESELLLIDNEINEIQKQLDNEYNEYIKEYTTNDYIQENLVVHYDGINRGDESGKWKDLSPNGNDGEINGATWSDENGLTFDGDDYVSIKDLNYNQVTVQAIVSSDGYQAKEVCIACNFQGGGYGLTEYQGLLRGNINVDGTYYFAANKEVQNYGQKYIITMTYDGSRQTFYMNGQYVTHTEVTGEIKVPTEETIMMLGSNPQGSEAKGGFFKGKIYSFRLYNKALSEDEVKQNAVIDNSRYKINEVQKINVSDYYNQEISVLNPLYTLNNNSYVTIDEDNNNMTYSGTQKYSSGTIVYTTPIKVFDKMNLNLNLDFVSGGNTVRVGYSTTSDFTENFASYIDITKSTANSDSEYNLFIDQPGTYYLKIRIVPLWNSYSTIRLNSIKFSRTIMPVRQIAELEEVEKTGKITSSTYSLINNRRNANLILDGGYYYLNETESYLIQNAGYLTMNANATLESTGYGISNLTSGYIGDGNNATIIATTDVINNISNIQESIDNYNFTVKNGTQMIITGKVAITNTRPLVLNNITTNGKIKSTADLTINNSNLTSSGIYGADSESKITINNSNFAGSFTDDAQGNYIFNNSTMKLTGSSTFKGNLTFKEVNLLTSNYGFEYIPESSSFSLLIENSNFNFNVANAIDVETDYNTKNYIKNTSIKTKASNPITLTEGKLYFTGNSTVENTSNSVLGIALKNYDDLYLQDNFEIKGKFTTAISNNSSVTVGNNDDDVNLEYPKIIGQTYGIKSLDIYNGCSISIYDGYVEAANNNSINGRVFVHTASDYEAKISKNDNIEKLHAQPITDYVASIGDNKYKTLTEAINSITSTEEYTIKILRNFINTKSFEFDKKIINLDLNGFVITDYSNSNFSTTGRLTINDSSEVKDENGIITTAGTGEFKTNTRTFIINHGTITLNSGLLDIMHPREDSQSIINYGVININGGTIHGVAKTTNSYSLIENERNAKFNMTGGTIEKANEGSIIDNLGIFKMTGGTMINNGGYTVYNTSTEKVTISNSTFYTLRGIYNSKNMSISNSKFYPYSGSTMLENVGTLTVSNVAINGSKYIDAIGIVNSGTATLSGNNKFNYAAIQNKGTMTINNGEYISYYRDLIDNSSTKTLTINNGTFTAERYIALDNTSSGSVIIKNGVITNSNGIAINNAAKGTITLGIKGDKNADQSLKVSIEKPEINSSTYGISNSSGKFNFYDGIIKATTSAISGNVTEVEEGYEVVKENIDGKEVKYLAILPVAKVVSTSETYYTIQEAVDAVETTDEIELLRDITILTSDVTVQIPEGKTITLDINGFDVNIGNEIFIENNGTLSLINASGNVISNKGIIVKNNGTLNINNGTFTAATDSIKLFTNNSIMNITNGSFNTEIENISLISNLGTLTINGGTFSSKENIIDNSQNLTINGGTFNANKYNIKNSGEVTINDGIFKTTLTSGFVLTNSNVANIYGGNYSEAYYLFENIQNATMNIKDTTIDVIRNLVTNSGNLLIENLIVNLSNTNSSQFAPDTLIKNINASATNSVTAKINNLTVNKKDSSKNYYYNYILNNGSLASMEVSNSTINNINNSFIYNKGNINLDTINITTSSTLLYNEGSINISNSEMTSGLTSGYSIINSGGTLNIDSSKINSSSNGISNTGIVNLGVKDQTLNTTLPSITSTGISINNTANAILNLYDGIIVGTSAINGPVNEIEDGYEVISTIENSIETKTLSNAPAAKIESTGVSYNTLNEAINAVTETNEKITLLREITITSNNPIITISSDKNITIDLNGKKLDVNKLGFIENNGTLTFDDSSKTTDEEGSINYLSNINIYKGSFVTNNGVLNYQGGIINYYNITNLILNNNIFNINGGVINYYTDSSNATTENQSLINNIGTLNINSGKLNNNNANANFISNSGILNYENGTLLNTNKGKSFIYNLNTGNLIFNNGVIEFTSTFLTNAGTAELNSTTLSSSIGNSGTLKLNNVTITDQIANSGSIEITDGTYDYISNTGSTGKILINSGTVNSTIYNNDSSEITIKDGSISYLNVQNSSIANIYGGTISGICNDCNSSSRGNSKMYIHNATTGYIKNKAYLYIYGGTINNNIVNDYVLELGKDDGIVSTTIPNINSSTTGINNNYIFRFYDGVISGTTAIVGTVNDIPDGYKIVTNTSEEIQTATLTLIGEDERVAVVNGINYTDLQAAINSVEDNVETNIVIYSNITLTDNITVPENKIINLYLNDFVITYGDYNFIKNGTLNIIESGTPASLIGNIINKVKNVLNIDTNKKNIIIYEMEDGSKLSSEKTYTLYKQNTETYSVLKMNKDEEVARYSMGNETDKLTSIKGRLYLNNLNTGNYKLVDNDGKEISFEITADGKLIGKVFENLQTEDRKVVATAIAELILTIQTGILRPRYIILTILISILIMLLFIAKKQKESFE